MTREESPDTEIAVPQGGRCRAARLVTPGGCVREDAATESATETKPPVRSIRLPPQWQAGRETFRPQRMAGALASALVRVKRWGKSPPREQQCSRHGKPRAVQDQIGGEGWLGPPPCSALRNGVARFARIGYQPSGRSLEPQRELRPRGMVAARIAGCAAQNPAYRPVRLTSISHLRFFDF